MAVPADVKLSYRMSSGIIFARRTTAASSHDGEIGMSTARARGTDAARSTDGEGAAALGYFSVDHRTAMRTMGLREIGHGVAILSNEHPAKAVWSRVAGDALDLVFLGRTLANRGNDRGRALFATMNVLAVAALDVVTARTLSR